MLDTTVAQGTKVLVLIPALNEEAHIELCLRSILKHDELARKAAVCVADGGSTDATRDIVKKLSAEFPNIRLLDNPKRLQSAAMNLALDPMWADRDILVRCDCHAVYPAGYVSRLIAVLHAKDAASVVVPLDSEPASPAAFATAVAWVSNTPFGTGGSAHRAGRVSGYVDHGHHAAFRLDAFRAVGGYDETMVANEDAELDRRITRNGGRIWLDCDNRVTYFPRDNPRRLWQQYFRYGYGRATTCLRHGQRPKLRQLAPVLIVLAILIGLLGMILWQPWLLLPSLIYLLGLVFVSARVAYSHDSAKGLLAGAAAGIMHVSWGLGFLSRLVRGREG